MKRIILGLIGLTLSFTSVGQTIEDIGKIVIGVKILPNSNEETLFNKEYLQNKLLSLASNAGLSSHGNSTFFITPSITINDIQTAEGGMKNVFVISGELYLNIKDEDSGTIFANTSYSFKGSGTSKEAAIKNGLQKISYGKLSPFFDEAKSAILNYYSAKQDKIFANADMLCQNNDYDAAIACLLTIPEELFDIYKKAYAKACDIYKKRDQHISAQIAQELKDLNNQVLVHARSLMAAHDAKGTLMALWDYKMSGTEQDGEYYSLLNQAEERISAEEKAALEKERQEYEERRLKEERAYADSRKEYEDNLQDRRQAYTDEVQFRHRQFDLESKRMDYQRAGQQELTDAVKTVAVEYFKNH